MLTGTRKVTAAECEQLIQDYLGSKSIYDDDFLIEAISGLIYSDGDVAVSEATLLTRIQSVPTPAQPDRPSLMTKLRQLYQNWLQNT